MDSSIAVKFVRQFLKQNWSNNLCYYFARVCLLNFFLDFFSKFQIVEAHLAFSHLHALPFVGVHGFNLGYTSLHCLLLHHLKKKHIAELFYLQEALCVCNYRNFITTISHETLHGELTWDELSESKQSDKCLKK